MATIDAAGLAIEFPLYHHNARSLKQRILASSGLRLKQDADNRVVVAALRDLTFSIGKGDRVALVGPNGAGKTTLLRTIAGVYEPVAGRLRVEGRDRLADRSRRRHGHAADRARERRAARPVSAA